MSFQDMSTQSVSNHDIAYIKANMPITFVVDYFSPSAVWELDSGEWVTHNPFRADRNPSFRVYGKNLDSFIDFADGDGKGDVLDLIGMFIGSEDISEQLAKANELYPELYDYGGPRKASPKASFDVEQARLYVQQLENQGVEALSTFFRGRKDQLRFANADTIATAFGITADEHGLVIPVKNRDGELVGMKTRALGGITIAAAGCDFADVLYGEHLDTDRKRIVVLCEGETDVWSASHALSGSGEFACLGLPTGAGSYPRQASRLSRRHVVLAFDGDSAGRKALAKWIPALLNEDCTVYVAPVPEDKDLSQVTGLETIIRSALTHTVRRPIGKVGKLLGGYRVPTGSKGEMKTISNFTLDIVESLITPDGETSYTVRPDQGTAESWINNNDLSTGRAMKAWAASHGLDWSGSDADTAGLAALLRFEQYGSQRRTSVSVAGLWEGHFIWPGDSLGPKDVAYRPPTDQAIDEVVVKMTENVSPQDTMKYIAHLRNMHQRKVTDPMLCWMAAAPLRSLFDRFPILSVTGGSGSGKTTLLERMISGFSGSQMMSTLTGTTRFGLLASLGSTNAFVVWFDEYRPGARNSTIQELNQLLRDAYAGQASKKSAGGDSWNEIQSYETSAPIVVSGEDTFTEVSHKERMILLNLPETGKGDLAPLNGPAAPSPVARGYLEFLLGWLKDNDVVVSPAGPDHWADRQRYNLGVLNLGAELLDEFMSNWDDGFGTPDLSMVYEANDLAVSTNPLADGIEWALGQPQLMEVVFRKEQDIWVNVRDFVAAVGKTDITLPGGTEAISNLLISRYGGERERNSNKRYIRIPATVIE